MSRMFEIEIGRPGNPGAASLTLPAAPWGLRDALDIARITDKRDIYTVETLSCRLPYLVKFIPESANLYELNHLAQRFSELDDWQLDCFEGMVKMGAEKGAASIPVERLINFTHSLENCQIAFDVSNDKELGKFYVDNDFPVIPEGLPEVMYDMLDYESIGRKMRMGEGGVFTGKGYVVHSGSIAEVYHSGDAVPREKPDYAVLLRVTKGFFNDPEYDNDLTVFLKLPAKDGDLDRAVEAVGAVSPEECAFAAEDCIVPILTELISDTLYATEGDGYGAVDELAVQLQTLEQCGELATCKAMLAAAPDDLTLDEALDLSSQTGNFALLREADDPADYARVALEQCDIPLREELIAGANLHRYGQKLMERDMAVPTLYGFLSPLDGQTVEQCLGRPAHTQGMEMK